MKTVISHFYNEEYLLPWWLNHHKELFDHGILIDYSSTDRSVEIIKDICPDWEVRKSCNTHFDVLPVDREVMEIEQTIEGFKLCLNTTEFFIPVDDFKPGIWAIRRATIVDEDPATVPTYDKPLIEQKNFGFMGYNGINGEFRFVHDTKKRIYGGGRHNIHLWDEGRNSEPDGILDSLIFWYGFAPYTEQLLARKLQIRERMLEGDRLAGRGFQHWWGKDDMDRKRVELLTMSQKLIYEDPVV